MSRIAFRSALKGVFNLLFRVLTRADIQDSENIPEKGGFIIVSNHLNILDAPLAFVMLDRDDATGFVAKKHHKNIVVRPLVNLFNGIWLNRQEADTRALRAARKHLKDGGVFGIAPEGTRSPTGSLIHGKTGTAYLAEIAKVPILPMCIYGSENAGRRILFLQRPHIHIRIGKLFTLPPINRNNRDADLIRNSDEIMCQIAALLPPEYHGAYSDHPRLQELLEKNSQEIPSSM